MIINYLISLVFLFTIFFVTQGYGILTTKIIFKKYNFTISETGFFGFFLLLIISLSFHFFLPLSNIINFIILLIGTIIFFYFKKNVLIKYIKYFLPLILFLSLLTISLKYHSDYFWYHLPYINILNQYKIIFGSSNLNDFYAYGHGWLDIMALFTLPYFDNKFSSLISIIFLSYFIFYLIDNFFNTKSEILKVFCLLSMTFLFLQYPLIKDYGAEIHINLIYILIFINIFRFQKNLGNKESIFTLIIFFFVFLFFLRLNSIIFLPLIFLFIIYNLKFFFYNINTNKTIFSFYLFSIFVLVLKNFIISGCLAYPIYFTCFDNISWGAGIEHAYERYLMLSAQSKGYLLYIVKELEYLSIYDFYKYAKSSNFISPFYYLHDGLSWINYWIKYEHDKSRLINIIIFLLIILILSKLINYKNFDYYESFKTIKRERFLIAIYFFPIISYFYLLPQGRYGGFSIIYVFFSLLLSLILRQSKNFILFIFLSISILYFIYKNVYDINHKPFTQLYPKEDIEYISKEIKNNNVFNVKLQITEGKPNYCNNIKKLCLSDLRYSCLDEVYQQMGYIFIIPKQNNCTKIIKNYFFF